MRDRRNRIIPEPLKRALRDDGEPKLAVGKVLCYDSHNSFKLKAPERRIREALRGFFFGLDGQLLGRGEPCRIT